MDSLRDHLDEISPQLESFWDEHAHPALNQLITFAPMLVPVLAVYHYDPSFLLKTYLAVKKTPLQAKSDPKVDAVKLKALKKKAIGVLFKALCIWLLMVIPSWSLLHGEARINAIYMTLLTPLCAVVIRRHMTYMVFRSHDPVVVRNKIGVPSIKVIKREGIKTFHATLPFITAFIIALGAFTYNNTVMRSISFAFLLHMFSVDSARKTLRFRQLWLMTFMFTVFVVAFTMIVMFLSGESLELEDKPRADADEINAVMKWNNWFYSAIWANFNLSLLSYCYRIDYENAFGSESIQLPLEASTIPIPAPEGPFSQLLEGHVGVNILSQTPANRFSKPYYRTTFITWVVLNLVCVWGTAYMPKEMLVGNTFILFSTLLSAPFLGIAILIVALFKGQVKILWYHKEEWQLVVKKTTVEEGVEAAPAQPNQFAEDTMRYLVDLTEDEKVEKEEQ